MRSYRVVSRSGPRDNTCGLAGTNRFYADAGHLDFLGAATKPDRTDDALEIAFDVPEANRHPAF